MFKAIVRFKDLQDNGHLYEVGDIYPRKGSKPSADRIGELASKRNRRNIALIEEVEEEKEAEPVKEEPQASEPEKPKKPTTTRKSTRAKTKK